MIFKLTFKHLLSRPFSALFTILSIGGALAMLGSFWTLVANLDRAQVQVTKEQKKGFTTLYVFVDPQASDRDLTNLKNTLRSKNDVSDLSVLSSEDSLKILESQFGAALSQAFQGENLPTTLQVELKVADMKREAMNEFQSKIRSLPGVLDVDDGMTTLSTEVGTRTDRALSWANVFFVLIFTVVALLVSHLIRLVFESNSSEIETLKIIGASKRWIFTPLLCEGLILGALGSIFGVVLLAAFVKGIVPQYSSLLLPKGVELSFLPLSSTFGLLALGVFASLSGALLTWPLVARAPREIK